ncbi:MAG: hypothetical protein AB8B96_04450 [Lysobacterales bacterium]
MISAIQWFLFAMFVWACVLLMSALESRVTASGQARKAQRDDDKTARQSWWQSLLTDDDPKQDVSQPSNRENEMTAEIVELKDRIATLEAIVTDRKFQWEEELNKPST